MIEELHAAANGSLMGRLYRDSTRDRLHFEYDSAWRSDPLAFPLSLSMPLTAGSHPHSVVEPFLWGLLPDNDDVLRLWGRRFQVSPRNPFKLLVNVGEECAGAAQWLMPERVPIFLGKEPPEKVTWLKESEIAERMRLLVADSSAGRIGSDEGQFSLAGAQPKSAYHYNPAKKKWGIPEGSAPTTHIFKPATGHFAGYTENEHFCLRLAQALGFPTAPSTVHYFEDVPVIVVERYDRVWIDKKAIRIHQEDACQALGRQPHIKYQNQGGPSAAEILNLIRQSSTNRAQDEELFIGSLILNWLICGTDAHAKNYSFLIASGGQVRLAPLYDLSSSLPYPKQIPPRKATLAMKVGETYKIHDIRAREWRIFARQQHLRESDLFEKIRGLAQKLPEASRQVASRMRDDGIVNDIVRVLVERLSERSRECLGFIEP